MQTKILYIENIFYIYCYAYKNLLYIYTIYFTYAYNYIHEYEYQCIFYVQTNNIYKTFI